MAKPRIGFKGAKFKTGETIGYRPQLETATKLADLAVAEEVCLAAGLSMSPEELNHALKVTLETVPQLVATDGRVREFKDLLTWNRSATGRLDGPGGAWNDTCAARVLVQLKKSSKQLIDGVFYNMNALPTPKLDNVTYLGATLATNVVKVGQSFAAYGRNMQMLDNDYAEFILPNGTSKLCTCTSSDAAHAVFSWPQSLVAEAGTRLTFVMYSRGGSTTEGWTVNKKEVVLLAAENGPVITELNDGMEIATGDHIDCDTYGINAKGERLENATVKYYLSEDGVTYTEQTDFIISMQMDEIVSLELESTPRSHNAHYVKVVATDSSGAAERIVPVTY